MKKAKAEQFIDCVQNALILGRRTSGHTTTTAWSVLYDLEQASHAAVYIPHSLSAEDAAREFIEFLSEMDQGRPVFKTTPSWLHAFVVAELDPALSAHDFKAV